MKVFLVIIRDSFSGDKVDGVYATLELARAREDVLQHEHTEVAVESYEVIGVPSTVKEGQIP